MDVVFHMKLVKHKQMIYGVPFAIDYTRRNTALGPSGEWAMLPKRESDGDLMLCGWMKEEA